MSHRPLARAFLVCLAAAFAATAQAQVAHLVRDLSTGTPDFGDSSPRHLLALGGKVFFEAQEASSGQEIWVSDGTDAGTRLLADSCPGFCPRGSEIVGAAGALAFWRDGLGRLWRSDGTRPGSRPLLPDTLQVPEPSDGARYVATGSRLFFPSCDPRACSLWTSDGTDGGTRSFHEEPRQLAIQGALAGRILFTAGFFPGASLWTSDGTATGTAELRGLPAQPRLAAAAGGRLFLLIPNGDRDELWASDGTAAGTALVAAVGVQGSVPWLKADGGRVVFPASDLPHGQEVWRSDGTPQGTGALTAFGYFEPFRSGLDPDQLEPLGGRVLFFATDGLSKGKLWAASAGSPAVPLAEICADCQGPEGRMARVGGRVVFPGWDAAHGLELWTTDGTPAGTARLTDACPGPCSAVDFDDGPFAAAGAAFAGLRMADGSRAFWRTDGTPAGTRAVATGLFGAGEEAVTAGGRLFFPANDFRYGWELWTAGAITSGGAGGADSGPVTDVARGAAGSGSTLTQLTPFGDRLAFVDAYESTTWTSGGTAETTAPIDDRDFVDEALTVAGGRLFYLRDDFGLRQLWVSDGTAAGTHQVSSFTEDLNPGYVMAEFQGRAVFPVNDRGTVEIWTSDGTPAGTVRAFDLPREVQAVSYIRSLGDRLFFVDGTSSPRPWLSDGTAAGTVRLSASPLEANRPPEVVRLGPLVLFAAGRLWRSDGTAAGTAPVLPADAYVGQLAHDLTVLGGALYFLAGTDGGPALWRSDGTPAGTAVVKRFAEATELTQAGGRLFLSADDGADGGGGFELWTSDGTAAGTVLVRDVYPGATGSGPSSLAEAAGRLWFAADDGVHGAELWTSDGTATGTRLVQDIAPEAPGSRPRQLTAVDGQLFFTADDGDAGRELWALPLGEAPGVCVPTATSLCLGGHFRVEASWRDPEGHAGPGRAVALTADTGYFWFFDAANVETVVKVLDGQALNGHSWVFYGALSNVEYSLTVTDVRTGLTRRYFNPQGRFASVGDTQGFGPLGAYDSKSRSKAAPASCAPGPRRLCLNGGRFAVEASWKDFSGRTGSGTAVPLTGDTGYFWFFDAANVESVVKVLDGRPVNGRFWVYAGALSNVEYTLTVTDTATGKVKTYRNPLGRFASFGDTAAF